MGVLVDLMLECKGDYDIDDPEIRWVTDRIEYWQTDDRILTKKEMTSDSIFLISACHFDSTVRAATEGMS